MGLQVPCGSYSFVVDDELAQSSFAYCNLKTLPYKYRQYAFFVSITVSCLDRGQRASQKYLQDQYLFKTKLSADPTINTSIKSKQNSAHQHNTHRILDSNTHRTVNMIRKSPSLTSTTTSTSSTSSPSTSSHNTHHTIPEETYLYESTHLPLGYWADPVGIPAIGAGMGWPFWGGMSVLRRGEEVESDDEGVRDGEAGRKERKQGKEGRKGVMRRGWGKLRGRK